MSLLTGAWEGAGRGLAPLAPAWLARRAARGKEDPARLGERTGQASLPRPDGPLVWLHAVSVGETTAVLPLAARLAGERPVLLTTGTVTSAGLVAARAPAGVLHQYAPLDAPPFLARFLDHWRPVAALFAESEIWPAAIAAAARRAIPFAVVNARLSERSFRGWRRAGPLARPLFGALRLVAAQSRDDAARWRALGAPSVHETGNLKGDVAPLPADGDALARLADAVAGRPVLLAASTHPGEEALVLAARERLARERPELLLVLVPRHPERGPEVAALAAGAGAVAVRSRAELPGPKTAVYVADTLGELGLFYRLAPVVVLGGSFAPVGGHNPYEPARLDCAILTGPAVHNFRDVFAALFAAGGAASVADAAALAAAASRLLDDPHAAAAMAAHARSVAEASAGALERTLAALAPVLSPAPGRACDAPPP